MSGEFSKDCWFLCHMNVADISYTNEGFFKICEDYGVPHDAMRYRDEKFYWTYQRGVRWQDD